MIKLKDTEIIEDIKNESNELKTNTQVKVEHEIEDRRIKDPTLNELLIEMNPSMDTDGCQIAPISSSSTLDGQLITFPTESFEPDMVVCDILLNDQQYFSVKRKNCYQYDLSK